MLAIAQRFVCAGRTGRARSVERAIATATVAAAFAFAGSA